MKDFIAVILAAGEGTRMKSALPKVLHPICGRRMFEYSLDLVKGLNIKPIMVVSSKQKDQIKGFIPKEVKIVYQKKQLGTADAIKAASSALKGFKGNVLIIYADNPLLKQDSIKDFIKKHKNSACDCTLLTSIVEKPLGYGRVIRDNFSNIVKVVEDRDANIHEKSVKEINTGIICFKKEALLSNLKRIKPNNKKKEYYLTDIVSILREKNCRIESHLLEDVGEAFGVNSRLDLLNANKVLRLRIMNELLEKGVTIIDPDTTYIDAGVTIGQDTTIHPFSVIESNVKIGKNCSVGPFCRLRRGVSLEDNVLVGNFIELNRSKLGKGTRVKHFSYLGDSVLGKKVNIGAGTVTANYDGKNKNATKIDDGAFLGCDTVVVAPARIGKNVITGAGSVIVRNKSIPNNAVVVGVPARFLKKNK